MTFVPVQSALLFVFFLTRSHENLPSSDVFSPHHRRWLWRMQGRRRGLGECLRGTARLWDGWFGVPGVPHKTPSWGGTGPPGWGTHLRRSSLPSKPWEPGPIPGAGEGAVDAAGTPQPQGPLRAAVARLICWKLVFFQGCAVPVNESGAAVLWAM